MKHTPTIRKVFKMHESVGVILPKNFTKQLKIQAGDKVQIEVVNDLIYIGKVDNGQ